MEIILKHFNLFLNTCDDVFQHDSDNQKCFAFEHTACYILVICEHERQKPSLFIVAPSGGH